MGNSGFRGNGALKGTSFFLLLFRGCIARMENHMETSWK